MNKTVRALGVLMVALFALSGADVATGRARHSGACPATGPQSPHPTGTGTGGPPGAGEHVHLVTSRTLPARSA
jgi:hypothetical protein